MNIGKLIGELIPLDADKPVVIVTRQENGEWKEVVGLIEVFESEDYIILRPADKHEG